ncbi:MAG: hypothetical protein WAX57_02565 [Minisyncoccia bacterium]
MIISLQPQDDNHEHEEEERQEERPVRRARPSFKYRMTALASLALISLLVVGGAGYAVYARVVKSKNLSYAAAGIVDPEAANMVEKVGKLMLLPEDEQPTLATVSDLGSLEGQLFFANAELGDIVLMYPKASRAILYSPSRNKIIEVAPITVGAQ